MGSTELAMGQDSEDRLVAARLPTGLRQAPGIIMPCDQIVPVLIYRGSDETL